MTNQPVLDLGLILNDIKGYEFSMKDFNDRLKLQKTIYLLQSFNIDLGYDFNWYLRGPYCRSLTTNGFILNDITFEKLNKKIYFLNDSTQKSFEKFKKFMKGKKDVDDLEILASLHFLKKFEDNNDEEIKNKVVQKQSHFTRKKIDEMWKELKKWNILPKKIKYQKLDHDEIDFETKNEYGLKKYNDKSNQYTKKDSKKSDSILFGRAKKLTSNEYEREELVDYLSIDYCSLLTSIREMQELR